MSAPSISFIVLSYADAPALPGLIADLHRVLAGMTDRFEVIVVDDASPDDSAERALAAAERLPGVRVIVHERNRGVGATFASGVRAARGNIIGYTDGDAQYVAEDLPTLLAALAGADAVSGIRVNRADGAQRTIISRAYNGLLRLLYPLELRDTNSGLKLYRRGFLEAAFPLVSRGPFYDAELLIKGLLAGQRVVEVPIGHRPREFGENRGVKLGSVRRALAGACSEAMRPYRRDGIPRALLVRALQTLAGPTARERGRAGEPLPPRDAIEPLQPQDYSSASS